MPTLYPSSLDDNTTLPDDKTDSTVTETDHASHHNNLADAVRAIEVELGINPSGTYSTVAAAILDKVDFAPTANQTIQGTGDIVGLAVKATAAQNTANVFEMRLATNALGTYIDKSGNLSAQALKIAGAALASTHLSDSALLARLASPTFSGTPTAPTAVAGTNSSQIATTAFVLAQGFAALASPTFTGTPHSTTPTAGDNSTRIATTAFVASALSSLSTTAGSSGTLASRPAATSNAGKFYYATDQAVLYFSDGSTWIRQGIPAGTTVEWFSTSVPTGWVAYNGGVLGGSTGIYADLYAHLGNTTALPDTRGRVVVSQGTHTDVATIGNNDGVAVGSRRPKHNSTVHDPTHSHASGDAQDFLTNLGGGGAVNFGAGSNTLAHVATTATASTGITVGPQTGAEPLDTPAYIVALRIAKL